jgi:hypothetical protein
MARVRDEHLRAVEDVLVTAALGDGLDARRVGAGVGLGERERTEERLVEERRQPRLLLLVGTRDHHRRRPEDVRHDRDRDPRAAPGELLADEHALEGGESRAAELLGHVDVHQPELVRLLDQVGGVGLMLVVLGRLGADLLVGELARERAQLTLLRRQGERDASRDARLQCCHARSPGLD